MNYITNEQLNQFIDAFEKTIKFSNDISIYNECKSVLSNYDRETAIRLIQKVIKKYNSEINQFGFLFDGTYVICGVDYSNKNDLFVRDQLIYLGQRIPLYVAIREGLKNVEHELLNMIGEKGFCI